MTIALADRLSLYIASRYPDTIVSDLDFFVSGFESEIYTFCLQRSRSSRKNYVLRLFTGEGAAEKLTREARALSLLQRAGYPVPALLVQETDPGILGKPFEIIDRLQGQALWPLLASTESQREGQLLSRFGALLARLHQLDWRSFTANPGEFEKNPALLLDQLLAQYRSLYAKYNCKGFIRVIDWLNAHKSRIRVRPAVVHQDFHANNVLLCPNDQLFVIDWTQFAVSDYRLDISWMLLIMGDLGNAEWGKRILDAYVSAADGPIEHLDYFNVIVYVKLLASTVISFAFSPEELGLRPDVIELTQKKLSTYKQLARRVQNITGLNVPELENIL